MISKGLVLSGTAAGGLTSGITGWILSPEVVVDEISNNLRSLNKYNKTGYHLSKLRTQGKLPEVNLPKTRKSSSPILDHYYFGSWKYRSEGGGQPLYLIDTDQQLKIIPVEGHSQAEKDLWNGHKISFTPEGWFGSRKFQFEDAEKMKEIDPTELWTRYGNIIAGLQAKELKELNKKLSSFDDDQWCVVIDIFWDCTEFKNTMIPTNTEIKDGIVLSLENILLLSRHKELDKVWENLSPIIDKTVTFKKIQNTQKHISTQGVKWLKKYFQDIKDEKMNPVKLYFWIGKNKEFGFECHVGDKWEKDYFQECNDATNNRGGALKVTHVIKSTVDWVTDGNRYLPKKDGIYDLAEKDWEKRWHAQHKMKTEDKKELEQKIKELGIYKGIVDENCNQFNDTLFGILETKGVETRFCKEIMETMFGKDVKNKRFCRYEIPNASGYLRAYRFSFLTLTKWYKGNKFWAKCNANGH